MAARKAKTTKKKKTTRKKSNGKQSIRDQIRAKKRTAYTDEEKSFIAKWYSEKGNPPLYRTADEFASTIATIKKILTEKGVFFDKRKSNTILQAAYGSDPLTDLTLKLKNEIRNQVIDDMIIRLRSMKS